jgi:tetratricopeptide (TPR) repeat protein
MTRARPVLAVFLACVAADPLLAQSGPPQTVETFVSVARLEDGVGVSQRPRVDQAQTLIKQQKYAEAEAIVDEVLAHFEKLMSNAGATYLCFANREELNHYLKQNPDSKKVIWLDWAFGEALHKKAFLAAGRKQWDAALKLLQREIGYRPFAADPHTERGYVLNALGKRKEALQSYRLGLELSERFASSRHQMAVALRGIGWTLVELGDLEGARKSYERSLEIDPQSKVAKAELEFIRKRLAQPR